MTEGYQPMTQASFASALANTGQIMNGAFMQPASSFAIAEQPEIRAFFQDLSRVAPLLVEEAQVADLANLHRMGVACRLCGQFDLAEGFYKKALELAQTSLGADAPETATHRNFLAGLYFMWGRYDESIALIEQSLQVYRAAFGAEHIYTRLTHFGLALAYAGKGDRQRSRVQYDLSALQTQVHVEAQSKDRWSNFTAKLSALAAAKYEQGRYDQAVELFRHCVIHEANEAWPGSLVVAQSLSGLAVLCRSQQLDGEALEFCKMALHMKKELCGESHPEYQATLRQYQELQESYARRVTS
ncbi:MAG: tetratricopeptide repeat protein [Cyanobacteria bacterium SZAS LIN-3]|nr:tetratricopeptide repeat protein [Cyanobacteria bacterium SZAS LIN-3]